ncbi:hypothetical protein KHS38_16930 [Mucilaginibacter sp. Bleaf8]|uniref:hypothetical protein n=1 Tax=Mucilaginibacter sp. Bleaf8 TaxID=2834430 RepID=UPI001BD1B992|nr:hypothetical protein [Mucilaginibacter sp. Bleaf8]MBS7566095.1 hypothetical protein [Mucilaginibacter sp. Bleaf8]
MIRATANHQNHVIEYYQIDISEAEASKQSFIKQTTADKQDLEQLKLRSSSYNWIPYDGDKLLFVQITPQPLEDDLTMLDLKGNLEDEIATELEKEQLGEWMASDLGPGGANMLFTVYDIDSALTIVLSAIGARHLSKNTIIARRVMTKQDDWFYEVLYPAHFTGQFNTM